MPGPADALGYRRPPATVAYDDLHRDGLPPVLFAHTFLPEGVTICDVRGFAALIEQAHHDRALLTLPDGEDRRRPVPRFPQQRTRGMAHRHPGPALLRLAPADLGRTRRPPPLHVPPRLAPRW